MNDDEFWAPGGATGLRCSANCTSPIRSGLLYSAFTYFTGFRVILANTAHGPRPYGEPNM